MTRVLNASADIPFNEDELAQMCENANVILDGYAQGNLAKGRQLRFVRAEGGLYRFHGEINLTLKPHTTERRIEGQLAQGGPVVSTRAEAGRTLAGLERAAQQSDAVRKALSRFFAEEEAAGFGLERDRHILLPETKSIFSMTEKCTDCDGIGQRSCTHCLGQGAIACAACKGQGQQTCPACHGARFLNDSGGHNQPCTGCHGQGYQVCSQCRGQMRVSCPKCSATMHEPCLSCSQTGWHSVVFENAFELTFTFKADLGNLPPEASRAIMDIGLKKMARDGVVDITPSLGATATGAIKGVYDAVLPLAFAEFSTGDAPFQALIAGKTVRLLDAGRFIDPIVKPGINALQKISKGPMALGPLMAAACRFRLLRGVLSDLQKHSRKKSYQRLLAAYPLVLSEKYAKASVKYASMALESITASARRGGALLGATSAGVLYRLWFDPSIQGMQPAKLPPQMDMALDGIAVLTGLFMAVYAVRVRSLSSLRKHLPADIAVRSLPAAGKWGKIAILMALVLLAAVLETAEFPPRWYLNFKSLLPL